MTRKLFKNTMTALLALMVSGMLTCCINDEIIDTANSDLGEEYYIDFTFQSTSGSPLTRAEEKEDNFVDGTHGEHAIGVLGNFALFFNKDKKFLLASDLRLKEHKEIDSDGTEGAGNTEEAIYRTRFYLSKEQEKNEDKMPRYVLVVLNGGKVEHLKGYSEGTDINEILQGFWEEGDPKDILGFDDEKGKKFFTMTNSVYLDGSNIHSATEIKKDYIQKFSEVYDPNKVTKVYVERMVAKFSFKLPEQGNIFQPSKKANMVLFDDVNGGFNNDGSPKLKVKKWRIALTGWNMNALEPKSYIFKNIKNTEYFDDWNNSAYHRSHWGEDLNYDNESYPWQYRKAIDYNLNYYQNLHTPTTNGNVLRNYSFNELGLGGINNSGSLNFDIYIYTPENTYNAAKVAGGDGKNHDSRDELLAGTHLLVGAELQIESNTPDTYYTPEHLFRDRDGFFYETERACIAALVHNMNQALISNDTLRYVYYDWTSVNSIANKKIMAAGANGDYGLYFRKANGDWEPLTEEIILATGDNEVFTDEELKMAIATIRRGDGKRLPWIESLIENNRLLIGNSEQIKDGEIPSLKVYDTMKGDYGVDVANKKTEREADANNIKSLLYEWLGSVDHFNQGKMYYSHGVVDNPPIEKKKTMRYGVVRNKWYNFQLQEIKSLGTPVDDLDQPIVPERYGLNDQINFTLKILGWHEEETTVPNINIRP